MNISAMHDFDSPTSILWSLRFFFPTSCHALSSAGVPSDAPTHPKQAGSCTFWVLSIALAELLVQYELERRPSHPPPSARISFLL